jgi:hypothetical protein
MGVGVVGNSRGCDSGLERKEANGLDSDSRMSG